MLLLVRTDSGNPDFVYLVKALDAYLAVVDGAEHAFYDQYNKTDNIRHVVVAYVDDQPAGCGAIKEYEPGVMEIKRMYTRPEIRGKGVATHILTELEQWAAELGYVKCILETGKRQEEAVRLYHKNNYVLIPNYGQYAGVENSLCFEKYVKI